MCGGGHACVGRFEDPELRDIAANADGIMKVLKDHCGLEEGACYMRVAVWTRLSPSCAATPD